jgi:hypothetical protein
MTIIIPEDFLKALIVIVVVMVLHIAYWEAQP